METITSNDNFLITGVTVQYYVPREFDASAVGEIEMVSLRIPARMHKNRSRLVARSQHWMRIH